ncbi:MAG: hypothetical protein V4649_15760 [Bacteroidota bacterium]
MISSKDVENLLQSVELQEIETEIARVTNCSIYESFILINLSKKEIIDSGFSIEKIISFIRTNKKMIINFGVKLLLSDCPKMIGRGVSITYSIYLIFITEMREDFLAYLTIRRIPKPKKATAELIALKETLDTML